MSIESVLCWCGCVGECSWCLLFHVPRIAGPAYERTLRLTCDHHHRHCHDAPSSTTSCPPQTGLWSLIKRAPKAKIRRKTFEVDGPAKEGAIPLDARARTIFQYFKKYNYTVKSTGDVICFEGTYAASASQAAALTLYTLISMNG